MAMFVKSCSALIFFFPLYAHTPDRVIIKSIPLLERNTDSVYRLCSDNIILLSHDFSRKHVPHFVLLVKEQKHRNSAFPPYFWTQLHLFLCSQRQHTRLRLYHKKDICRIIIVFFYIFCTYFSQIPISRPFLSFLSISYESIPLTFILFCADMFDVMYLSIKARKRKVLLPFFMLLTPDFQRTLSFPSFCLQPNMRQT